MVKGEPIGTFPKGKKTKVIEVTTEEPVDEAMEFFSENLKKAEDVGDMVSIGRSLINIGIIENKKGTFMFRLDDIEKGLIVIR